MPLEKFECSICGAKCPKEYLAHGKMGKRLSWLRHHRQRMHPSAFRASVKKGVKARKGK